MTFYTRLSRTRDYGWPIRVGFNFEKFLRVEKFRDPRKCTEGFALIAETVGHESAERTAISIGLDAPLASAMCLAYFRHARPILCLRGASRPSLSSSRPFPTRRLCPLYPPSSSSSRWRDLVRSTNSDNELPGNRPRNSNGPPDFSRTRQRTGWRHLEPRRE